MEGEEGFDEDDDDEEEAMWFETVNWLFKNTFKSHIQLTEFLTLNLIKIH